MLLCAFMVLLFYVLVASGKSEFNSQSIGLKIQKKVAGKLATTSIAKTFIDDNFSQLLDTVHEIVAAEVSKQKADKLVKNIIKIVVKIAILYKNSKFSPEELKIGLKLREKIQLIALTVVSFHEVDFSYDANFLIKLIDEVASLTHDIVRHHLTDKSHGRVDNIVSIFGDPKLLDSVFSTDGKYHDKLTSIASVFAKVVDGEW